MLKINLMPDDGRSASSFSSGAGGGTKVFAIALAATLVVLFTALFLFHSSQQSALDTLKSENDQVDAQIRQIRTRVADHERVRTELAEIRAREEAIQRLEGARTGPTSMLVELSRILSPGGRPTSDPAVLDRIQTQDPSRMYNPTWDPHRLWVSSFTEENRQVEIEGDGRTADDVGEFMRRMMLSMYFEDVRLERSEGATDTDTHISVQHFRIVARVRY